MRRQAMTRVLPARNATCAGALSLLDCCLFGANPAEARSALDQRVRARSVHPSRSSVGVSFSYHRLFQRVAVLVKEESKVTEATQSPPDSAATVDPDRDSTRMFLIGINRGGRLRSTRSGATYTVLHEDARPPIPSATEIEIQSSRRPKVRGRSLSLVRIAPGPDKHIGGELGQRGEHQAGHQDDREMKRTTTSAIRDRHGARRLSAAEITCSIARAHDATRTKYVTRRNLSLVARPTGLRFARKPIL